LDAGTIGPTVSACATLARLFLKRGQLDSALKYYAWVYQLSGERRAEALRKELSPFIPAQSAERFQKVELLVQRYPYPRAIQADIPVIATEQGELINPTQVPVPVLLLFSSRTCGLCKQWYPRLIKEIAAARLPSRIIIVTPDRSRLEGLPAGTTVTYAPLSFELHRAFQIRGFPTVVVLRGGRVEYQGSLSSQQHLQTIMSLLQ
jgi:thioredoxin-like negative regulator of GroEL